MLLVIVAIIIVKFMWNPAALVDISLDDEEIGKLIDEVYKLSFDLGQIF